MNILDLIILAILAYGTLAGMYKGMITSGLKLFGFAGAWYGATRLYGRIAYFALSNRSLMAVLNQYLEPETYFTDRVIAQSSVDGVIESLTTNEGAIRSAVASVGERFSFMSAAFERNIGTKAFESLRLTTVSDYFNQTLWVAVFNVAAFLVAFILLYLVISLVINLLDKTINFPILRRFDWFVGGIFGFLRASVVVVMVLTILPVLLGFVDGSLVTQMVGGSSLFSFFSQFDLLSVRTMLSQLVMA